MMDYGWKLMTNLVFVLSWSRVLKVGLMKVAVMSGDHLCQAVDSVKLYQGVEGMHARLLTVGTYVKMLLGQATQGPAVRVGLGLRLYLLGVKLVWGLCNYS